MAGTYLIEFSEPSLSKCACCDGTTVSLTRFVSKDGAAFAVYFAAYSNNHPDHELAMLVSLGDWQEGSNPSRRAAFFCRVRATDESFQVMLGNADQSGWADAEIVGKMLSRDEALAHEWKATAFEVLDEAFASDASLEGFLARVRSGEVSVALERNFDAPDDIFALGEARKRRAQVSQSFAELDGKRFFVRCLLPIPVEGRGDWRVGVWIEVSKAEHARIFALWEDPKAYAKLTFTGTVANDLHADLGLPVVIGAEVELHVKDADIPPTVKTPATGPLRELLSSPWPKAEFEKFAVSRGFL